MAHNLQYTPVVLLFIERSHACQIDYAITKQAHKYNFINYFQGGNL